MPQGEKSSLNAKALVDVAHTQIMAYCLDPVAHPLEPKFRAQYDRVVQAARLLDAYPAETKVISLMRAKYDVTLRQIRNDIDLAKELFKSKHSFDWDFWQAWMIKDQVELIQRAKEKGDLKSWNAAKKTLQAMVGEKPVQETDPQRMMKNTFVIQVNNFNGQKFEIPLDQMQQLNAEEKKVVIDALYQPVDEEQVEEIFNS